MENLIANLESKKIEVLEVGKNLFPEREFLYHFDLYCVAQLNRSLNLLDGFIDLAKKDNFISALPLVRIHLDTLHRVFAFQLIDKNIDDVVSEILAGKQINKYHNKNNNKRLTDAELNEKLSEYKSFAWASNIYKAGNDFVHFSDKHILSSTIIEDKEKLAFSSKISHGSPYISQKEKDGACIYMGKITDGIFYFINSWIEHKKTYINHSP